MRTYLLVLSVLFVLSGRAQVAQIRWDVQQDRPVAHDVAIWQGETVDLMPRLVQGTLPVAVTNAPVEFRYREASLPTNTYRYVAASANTNSGVIAVRWIPDYDAGAAWYDYQVIVGSNAANPRVFGRITMRPTIGWPASTNAPAPVAFTNSQSLSLADWRSGSNALATAVQAAVAPLATTQQLASAVAPLATTQQLASAVAPLATTQQLATAVAPLATTQQLATAVAPLATTQQLAAVQAAIPLGSDAAFRLQSSDSNYFARVEPTGTTTTWKVSITTNAGTLIYGHYDLTLSTNFQTSTGIKPPTNYWHDLTPGVYTNGDWVIWINASGGPYRYCIRYGGTSGPIWANAQANSNVVNNITISAYFGTPTPQGSALLSCLYTPDTYTYTTNKVWTLVSLSMLNEAISNIPPSSAIASNGGSGTNIVLFGRTDLANALPTNLFARLYLSNELLVVERVLK